MSETGVRYYPEPRRLKAMGMDEAKKVLREYLRWQKHPEMMRPTTCSRVRMIAAVETVLGRE